MASENIYKGISKDNFIKVIAPLKQNHAMACMAGFDGRFNDFLIMLYAELEGCKVTEFHTFKGWGDLGYRVKRGEKAYRIFSSPKKIKVAVRDRSLDNEESKKEVNRFLQCCVFSINQVEKVEKVEKIEKSK